MYQALIRPILAYGCAIWFNTSPLVMEKIRKKNFFSLFAF